MAVNLSDLQPITKTRLAAARASLDAAKIKYFITSGYRSRMEQIALYAQGRDRLDAVNSKRKDASLPPITATENKYTITNYDGITMLSNHQSGFAVDIVPANDLGQPIWPPHDDPRWKPIADNMRANGWNWGGDWKKFLDYPHYEVKV